MKITKNIILFLSIILFIGLVSISFFNVYQTDDYIFSYTTKKLGLLENIVDFYGRWGGRYFGYSLSMLNPVAYDHSGILPKLYPIILMTSFIGVVSLNFKHFFKYSILKSIQKSFLCFFFYTILLVSVPEHYYWITGSTIYFLPVILAGILLLFLGKFHESNRRIFFYISCFLILILMGSNEMLALILEGLLLMLYLKNTTKESRVLLVIGTICLLISFLAPGNFKRLGSNEEVYYLKWFKRTGVFGLNSIYIFIKILLIIPLFIKIFEKEFNFITEKTSINNALILWMISLIPLVFAAYILITMGRPFENIIVFFFLTSALVWMYFYKNINKLWWLTLIIIFLPATHILPAKYSKFNLDFNLNSIVTEIFTTNLSGYEKEVKDRMNVLDHSTQDSIVVQKINNVPRVLYFDEMASENEAESYVNDQLQKYFNKKYIRIKD